MNKLNIKSKNLTKILTKFHHSKVLVVGDLMLDEFIWGVVSRISPEAPVPVVRVNKSSFMPGGACNVVNNIRALGGKVYVCGVIGQDQIGDLLLEEMREQSINIDGVIVDDLRPTTKKTRIIAHHQQVVRVDTETDMPIKDTILNRIIDYIEALVKEVDAVVIEDYGKGLIQPELIRRTITAVKKHKKIIIVDPKEEHFPYYKGVTLVTPNQMEAEVATSMKINDEKSLKEAANKLINKLKCQAALITLGEQGMALAEKNKALVKIPTIAREVFDVSGAGDTVVASFALSKVAGATMKEAAYISNIAAGIVVGKLGVAVVTPKELQRKIKLLKK